MRPAGPRALPPVRPSNADVELTLDLRGSPPDKVLSRLLGALERVSDDVVLYVLLRDTPEYVGVTGSIFQALRTRGYFSDSSRHPQGGQRLRVHRRRESRRPLFYRADAAEAREAAYVPPPATTEPVLAEAPSADSFAPDPGTAAAHAGDAAPLGDSGVGPDPGDAPTTPVNASSGDPIQGQA